MIAPGPLPLIESFKPTSVEGQDGKQKAATIDSRLF